MRKSVIYFGFASKPGRIKYNWDIIQGKKVKMFKVKMHPSWELLRKYRLYLEVREGTVSA